MISDDQIIEMAKQSGTPIRHYYDDNGLTEKELIAFARLIEAKVREEDAKLVDNLYHETYMRNIRDCAAAIRNSGGAA